MKKLFLIFTFLLWLPSAYAGVGWRPETWIEEKIFDFFFLITIGVIVGIALNKGTGIGRRFIGLEKSTEFGKGKEAYNKKDYKTAIQIWRSLAEKGDAESQFYLGWMYERGIGVLKDYSKALEWYRKSVEQGNPKAQNQMGNLYHNSLGVEQDYAEALKWYYKAAEQGIADAQNNIGWLYKEGKGVEQDYKKAMEWYQKAADQAHPHAQSNIGYLYHYGLGYDINYKEATKWYLQAARQGNILGQYNLAVLYLEGHGVSESIKHAYMWFSIAALRNDNEAKKRANEIEKEMSPNDIETAINMAKWCIESNYEECFDDFEDE